MDAPAIRILTDIPPEHHRVPYFHRTAEALSRSGRRAHVVCDARYAGELGLDAVMTGGDVVCVNASQLERVDRALAMLTLPFCLSDAVAQQDRVGGLVALADAIAAESGMRVLALMRGADQLFAHARDDLTDLAGLEGLRIRVAGPGVYEELMRAFGAEPAVQPIPGLSDAVRQGRVDAVFTSPGAWDSQVRAMMPNALHVPGAMMITYAIVCADRWYASLGEETCAALARACREEVTDNWSRMAQDDAALLDKMTGEGAVIAVDADVDRARRRAEPIVRAYAERYPHAFARFRDAVGLGG